MRDSKEHFWQPDKIVRRPKLAAMILGWGSVVYAAICLPLFGRRGFPEVDPFFLSAAWLWYVPFFAALIYDDRPKYVTLLRYSLVVSALIGASIVGSIPNHRTAEHIVQGIVVVGPILFVMLIILTTILRPPYRLFRKLIPADPICEKCGYRIDHLIEARCPECGTPFDPIRLDGRIESSTTSRPWKTWSFLICLILIGMMTTIIGRAWIIHQTRISGRVLANQEWGTSNVKWFVTPEELNGMTARQLARFVQLRDDGFHPPSQGIGLTVRAMWTDWEHLTWQSAYREVIEEKLRQSGQSPPDFGPP